MNNYFNYQMPFGKSEHQILNMTQVAGGIDGAKNYPLAPNITMPLWDRDTQKIYIKSTDISGAATYKVLSYEIEEEISNDTYVTKADLEKYMKEIKEMMKNGQSAVRESKPAVSTEQSDVPVFQ